MIVDASGRFVTQREEPRLALVGIELTHDELVLSAPSAVALSIPARLDRGPRTTVTIWRSTLEAIIEPAASTWISGWLGRDARVVYMPDDVRREINPAYSRAGDVVSFADGYPLLLASRSSLADLNGRLDEAVEMDRFRPNVVASGAEAWAEDRWAALSIGALSLRAPKPCERCVVVTIDPETAIAGKEPLRTLATFRKVDGKVLFGINLIPDLADDESVEIAVGDPVVPR